MAWLDDRVWAHPKVVGVSDRAFRVWASGICYSSGFGTRGVLAPSVQRQLGATKQVKEELVAAGLWEPGEDGLVEIHDWLDHNDARDNRREKDRLRKREERARKRATEDDPEEHDVRRTSRGLSTGRSFANDPACSNLSAGRPHAERVKSDGQGQNPSVADRDERERAAARPLAFGNGDGPAVRVGSSGDDDEGVQS